MANSLLGTPYRYGSNGPSSFDCSSFIQYTYRNALGVTLPRVSRDQARAGETVSKNDLQPGDIVAFNTFSINSLENILISYVEIPGDISSCNLLNSMDITSPDFFIKSISSFDL